MESFEKLRSELVRERERQGLTQSALAALLDVTQPVVARLEAGSDLKLSTLSRWAFALGKAVDPRLLDLATELGDPTGVLLGMTHPGGALLHLNPYAALERDRPPVTLLSGRPGSGKTELLRRIVTRMRLDDRPGIVVSTNLDGAATAIAGVPLSAPSVLPETLTGVLALDLFGRHFPSEETLGPKALSGPEDAARKAFQSHLPPLLALVPDGGFLVVEEAWALQLVQASFELFLRSARSRGIAVLLSSQSPSGLLPWREYASRTILLPLATREDAAVGLRLCHRPAIDTNLSVLYPLWEPYHRERYGLFSDLDRRNTLFLLSGVGLR